MRALAITASLSLHLGVLLALGVLSDRKSFAVPRVIEVRVARRDPPPPPALEPPPAPAPKPVPEVQPEVTPRPAPRRKRVQHASPPPAPSPPPAEPPPPEPESPPPPVPAQKAGFAVRMESTVAAGSVAVATTSGEGSMLERLGERSGMGRASSGGSSGGSGSGLGPSGPGGSGSVTRLPEFIGSAADRTPPYPESARARRIEGQVLLKVFVNTEGRVGKVRVVRALDPSCDAVAVKWAEDRFRFRPALVGGQPIGVWIDVPVTFVIDR